MEKYNEIKKRGDKAIWIVQENIKNENNTIKFFRDNDICPSCQSPLLPEYKDMIISKISNNLSSMREKEINYNLKMEKLNNIKEKCDKLLSKLGMEGAKQLEISNKIIELLGEIKLKTQLIESNINMRNKYQKDICFYQDQIEKLNKPKIDYNNDIRKIEGEIKDVDNSLSQISNIIQSYDFAFGVLSDNGIKQYIIKKYIPLLNKYVNEYLEIFQAPYRIIFNEKMEETIALNGYTTLSYDSLSAGEKARCDLSLLFGFLNISKNRNFVSSNVLFLDEVADANLDVDGLDGLLEIIGKLKMQGYTPITITHRKELLPRFDVNYYVEKKKFSSLIKG